MPGQATQGNPQPAPTPPTIDWNALVPVKVEGVEQMLPLREVANGYAAQQKMIQATTEADKLKKQLDRYDAYFADLEADPAQAVKQIQEHYKLTVEEPSSEGAGASDAVMAEMAKLRAEMAAMAAQTQNQSELTQRDRQIAGLISQHGDAVNRDELLAYATSKGVDNLDHAWLMMQGEKGPATQDDGGPQLDHNDRALQSILDRKANSLGKVAPGATAAPAGQAEQKPGPPTTHEGAFARALEIHGTTMGELMNNL